MRPLPRLAPTWFRTLALAALVAMCGIVVTGGAVRVTGSGLGCSSWPECEPGQLVAPLGYHHWVEFGNRLVSGFVVAISLAALAGAPLPTPRGRGPTRPAPGLAPGGPGPGGLGGVP